MTDHRDLQNSGPRGSLLSQLRLGTDLQNSDAVGHLKANFDLSDGPVLGSVMLGRDDTTTVSKSQDDHPLTRASVSSNTTELPQAKPNPFVTCEHSIVKMTFKKGVWTLLFRLIFANHRVPSSCQLSGVHGAHEKECSLVLSMQPYSSLQMHRRPLAGKHSPLE